MIIDDETYKEIREHFSAYLTEQNLRKTGERYTILDEICAFSGHFDIDTLYERLNQTKYHVSKATLYNTLEVLIDAGIIIRHQISAKAKAEYELRKKAEKHLHLVCTRCGALKELKVNALLKSQINSLGARFTAEYFSLCVYGICHKCKKKTKKQEQ
jgi:Fur family ferric uptake transcriptional regulator